VTADESLTSMSGSADESEGMQHRHALDSATSLADYAAATASTPELAGRTLRALAERRFTGEAILDLESAPGAVVRVHLDAGHPYAAEHVGDEPLGRRLVAAGVIEADQLQRGMVPVGDVEHLGRLFQRERSIDRDAVIAAVEAMTDELLTEVATERASVTITPYRHHRSGIHRWFVGPQRAPSPFDAPVRETAGGAADRPDGFGPPTGAPTSFASPASTDVVGDDLRVEWAEPIPPFDPPVAAPFEPPVVPSGQPAADAFGDETADPAEIDITAEIESFDADAADWRSVGAGDAFAPPVVGLGADRTGVGRDLPAPPFEPPASTTESDTAASQPQPEPEPEAPAPEAVSAPFDDEFTMVWPDGSEVDVDEPTAEARTAPVALEVSDDDGEVDASTVAAPPASADELVEAAADDMPEDVAEAVRRALAAIECAAADPAVPAQLGGAAADLPSLSLESEPAVDSAEPAVQPPSITAHVDDAASVATSAAVVPAPPGVFAPPTAAMRAEAVYERASAEGAADAPVPGQASVVFVDGDDDGDDSADPAASAERTSALKRLISSLRRGR